MSLEPGLARIFQRMGIESAQVGVAASYGSAIRCLGVVKQLYLAPLCYCASPDSNTSRSTTKPAIYAAKVITDAHNNVTCKLIAKGINHYRFPFIPSPYDYSGFPSSICNTTFRRLSLTNPYEKDQFSSEAHLGTNI